MKIFALAATLASARQRRAMTVNEQGGTWESQEAQVSNQVPQVSNQVPQVSDQVPQVSNQVAQVSNQVAQVSNQVAQVSNQVPQVSNQVAQVSNQGGPPPTTCEESYATNHAGMWYHGTNSGYNSMDTCDYTQLIRGLGRQQFEKSGLDDLSASWDLIVSEVGHLWTMDYYNAGKMQTGCGLAKILSDPNNKFTGMRGFSTECSFLCEHIDDGKNDFHAFLDQLAYTIKISFRSSMLIYI